MKSLGLRFALKKLNQRKWSSALSVYRREVRKSIESIRDERKKMITR